MSQIIQLTCAHCPSTPLSILPLRVLLGYTPTCRHAAQAAGASAADTEVSSDDDDDFWLSPRMACRLHFAGRQYVNAWCLQDSGGYDQPVLDDLPPVVVPYAKGKAWMAAYTQAAMRLVRRLEKGVELRPNCTGEEQGAF